MPLAIELQRHMFILFIINLFDLLQKYATIEITILRDEYCLGCSVKRKKSGFL